MSGHDCDLDSDRWSNPRLMIEILVVIDGETLGAHDCDLGTMFVDYVLGFTSFIWNPNFLQFLKA